MVAEMEMDMVADMELDNVADKVADMVADLAADIVTNLGTPNLVRELVTGVNQLGTKLFRPKAYPTCVFSKLCEFIADVNDLNRSANYDQQIPKKQNPHMCTCVHNTCVHMTRK